MNIKVSSEGFTLIELMITVSLLAVLAAVAIPSYRSYMIRNAESQAQARIHELELELEKQKSTRLTYRGFAPKKITVNNGVVTEAYEYDDGVNGSTIYIPRESGSANYKYKITLIDGATDTSLRTTTSGGSWRMFSEPNNSMDGYAYKYLAFSNGRRCRVILKSFNATKFKAFDADKSCEENGSGVESW